MEITKNLTAKEMIHIINQMKIVLEKKESEIKLIDFTKLKGKEIRVYCRDKFEARELTYQAKKNGISFVFPNKIDWMYCSKDDDFYISFDSKEGMFFSSESENFKTIPFLGNNGLYETLDMDLIKHRYDINGYKVNMLNEVTCRFSNNDLK